MRVNDSLESFSNCILKFSRIGEWLYILRLCYLYVSLFWKYIRVRSLKNFYVSNLAIFFKINITGLKIPFFQK